MKYDEFLDDKRQLSNMYGFGPVYLPDYLYDFQKALVEWAIKKGRGAIFADCGLGKSIMEIVWAVNVIKKTGGKVLLITPLAVGKQMVKEAEKFGIDGVSRSVDGSVTSPVTITNYERLHYFDPDEFDGVVLDESSILKNFNGARKHEINIFMRKVKYRLLATATAAPNDYIELGTSSEALGYLGYMDMLGKFFKNTLNNSSTGRYRGEMVKWRLKGHAHDAFWRWVTSWARAMRKPSDMGFKNEGFDLPELVENEHELDIARKPGYGELFTLPANGLKEVRDERRATITERCEYVADLINRTNDFAVAWCNLNDEGDLLEKLIPGSVQISGSESIEVKEQKLDAFSDGEVRVLITKPRIGGFGLNWQHCNHMTFFPNYSYEQYYQSVRRFWRFGQDRPVTVDLIYTHGDKHSVENLQRKQSQADVMFTMLVKEMNNSLDVRNDFDFNNEVRLPQWA